MNTKTLETSDYEIVNTLHSMLESANESGTILANAVEELVKLQGESCKAMNDDQLPSFVLPLSPEEAVRFVWQIPTVYQLQSQHLLKLMLDSAEVISRTQQELVKSGGLSFSWLSNKTTKAMTGINGALASRRVSAKIIHFADRRKSAPPQAHMLTPGSTKTEQVTSHRQNRQAAG